MNNSRQENIFINRRLNGSHSMEFLSHHQVHEFDLFCLKRITTDPDVNKRKQICTKKKEKEKNTEEEEEQEKKNKEVH